MAKKVIQNDNMEEVATRNASRAPEKTDEIPSAPKVESQPTREIPAQADRILRAFPNYPELYIDFQGGTYTVDTPPVFLSNATLYKNPYHKP